MAKALFGQPESLNDLAETMGIVIQMVGNNSMSPGQAQPMIEATRNSISVRKFQFEMLKHFSPDDLLPGLLPAELEKKLLESRKEKK